MQKLFEEMVRFTKLALAGMNARRETCGGLETEGSGLSVVILPSSSFLGTWSGPRGT
jgi:hypothetical protein